MTNNLVLEIKSINEHIEKKRLSVNKKVRILSNIFSKDPELCAICHNEIKKQDQHEGHKPLKSVKLIISTYHDETNLYNIIEDNYYNRVTNQGLCFKNGNLAFYEYTYIDGSLHTTEHFEYLPELERKTKVWIINNFEKFLNNYIKECNIVKKEYDDADNKAEDMINKILGVLKE